MQNTIKEQILTSAAVKKEMAESCASDIEKAAILMINCVKGGMTSHDRKPIPSIALTTDSSFLTAWSNDTDFDSVFSRQVQGLGDEGDVLVGISTSGNSVNVINAVKQAKYKGLKSIVFTGKSGGQLAGQADVTIHVPSSDTQRIQEGHIMTGQILCGLVESSVMN